MAGAYRQPLTYRRDSSIVVIFKICTIIGFSLNCFWATAQAEFTVTVTNISSSKGNILVALYNSEDTFLKKKYQTVKVLARKGAVEVKLTDIPLGDYAIAVIHDENRDEKFNSNFYGKPTEGFGFSNNARGLLGAPSYGKALVKIKQSPTGIAIRLKYF